MFSFNLTGMCAEIGSKTLDIFSGDWNYCKRVSMALNVLDPPEMCGSVKIIGSHDIPRFWFGLLGPGWESDVSKLGWLLFRRLWLFWFDGSSSWLCLLVLCPGLDVLDVRSGWRVFTEDYRLNTCDLEAVFLVPSLKLRTEERNCRCPACWSGSSSWTMLITGPCDTERLWAGLGLSWILGFFFTFLKALVRLNLWL